MKFHPDKNNGDDFFSERFKEIQEAYEILIDPSKRNQYDIKRNGNFSSSEFNKNNYDPVIEYFFSNKSEFNIGDEITFSWKANNADRVTLVPFGSVSPTGQKTYRINYAKQENLTFQLIAENSKNTKNTYATLTLSYASYQRLNPAVGLLVMLFVFLFLYMIFQVIL